MTNKSSPHGGFIAEGTIIHGTLRQQDLLRAFADELNRVLPFNSFSAVYDAKRLADVIDTVCGAEDQDFLDADETLMELIDQLNSIASHEGLYFGAHEGDGSDFGYWTPED